MAISERERQTEEELHLGLQRVTAQDLHTLAQGFEAEQDEAGARWELIRAIYTVGTAIVARLDDVAWRLQRRP